MRPQSLPALTTRRRFLHALTIRRKFLFACLLTAFLPLAAFAYLGFTSTSSSLRQQARLEMNNRSAATLAVLDNEGRAGLLQILSLGQWNAFCRAIDRRNLAWLEGNVSGWVTQNLLYNGVAVLTLDGRVITAAGQFKNVPLAGLPVVVGAVRRGSSAYDLQRVGPRLYVLFAGPVVEETSTPHPPRHGSIIFGEPINGALLSRMAAFTGANEIALYLDGRLAASSGSASPSTLPAGNPEGRAFAEGPNTVVLTVLHNHVGAEQGELRISVRSAAVAVTSSTLRRTAGYALLIALVIAVVISLIIAKELGRPLRKLAQAAHGIAAGETRQHVDVTSRDEIGEVAEAFNTMSERVAQELEDQTHKLEVLSIEVAGLNDFGETLAHLPDVHAELLRLTTMVQELLDARFAVLYECDQSAFTATSGSMDGTRPAVEELCAGVAATGEAASIGNGHDSHGHGESGNTVIAVPLKQSDAVGYVLAVGSDDTRFQAEDISLLATIGSQISIALHSADAYRKLDSVYLETVTALAAAMEAKDHYTAEHADTLATMTAIMGRAIGLADPEIRQLRYAAVLHDIGKIGIPGRILNKPAKLSKAEFEVMAQHTIIGERIISSIEYLRPIARIVRSAHERWDGKGYPDGLSGEQIPREARILLVCDAHHAMTSNRPYRKAMSAEDAVDELRAGAGTQFDPGVVDVFFAEVLGRPLAETVV